MIRLNALFLFFLLILGVIVAKLFYIQAFDSEKFATNDYLRTTQVQPQRGVIVDTHNEPFVINEQRYTLFAEPKNITDEHEIIRRVDENLRLGEATIEAKLATRKQWIALAHNLTYAEKESLEALHLPGLGFDETTSRFYPEASLAAHLTGFVGKDEDGDPVGYFGVEGFYDKDLEGLPGIVKSERDLLGKPIFVGTQDTLQGENGRKLVLTIDKSVQALVKKKLKAAVDRYQARSGCVTVAQPSTMAILAMVCLPDFDPTHYGDYTEKEFRNPVISDTFEPGSIFKPLIVAAALEEKKIDKDDTFDEDGPIKIGSYFIRTWDDTYHGQMTMTNILENSSNVGMVYIGRKLGDEKIRSYISRFGFGKRTDIDVQGEVASPVKSGATWYPIDYATATFGQGIAVSQIQMLTAFAAIVNGGNLMRPYVVRSMVADNGSRTDVAPHIVRRVVSDKTSKTIREMLRQTVRHGEAKWDVPDGYEIGGKTGTAQVAVQGAYDASKTNASFIGFAPVDKPAFIALVSLQQPQTSQWASETAAPLFFEIAKDLIVEYNIAPQ